MTSSLPNEPLWPRASRDGSSDAARSSSSRRRALRPRPLRGARARARRTVGRPPPTPRAGRTRGRPCQASSASARPRRAWGIRRVRGQVRRATGLGGHAQPFDAGQDPALAVVEPLLDVGREQEPATGRADAEGDGHRVVRLVADGHRDATHPELLGAGRGAAVEPDGGLAGRQPLDLDVAPADAAHAQPEDLADGLLGRPPAGHRLGSVAHVALLGRGQDALGEARPEARRGWPGCARP